MRGFYNACQELSLVYKLRDRICGGFPDFLQSHVCLLMHLLRKILILAGGVIWDSPCI